ncbi:MAG TPA: hypothetical protein VFW68_01125 [Rhodocyclaceae bacterium]|nr:hypothetical protein [Rhodocyclaceae bacterium]
MNLSDQMVKGILSTAIVIGLSLLVCVVASPDLLMGWGTLFLVAMVPAQMVVSLLWGCGYPKSIAALPQPWNGLAFLALNAAIGVVVGLIAWNTVGGGISPPTPFVNMYLILAVAVTLWLIIPFQAWPFGTLFKNPGAMGATLWLSAYGIAYMLFRALFNFSFLKGAPFYQASLDPAGLLMAWVPLIFSVASVMVILALVLLDFWPTALLAKKFPVLAKQPFFGIANAAIIASLTALVWRSFVGAQSMDMVVFLTQVCVSTVFGIFILLVMLEGVPSLALPQPWRGLVLITTAGLLSVALFALYRAIALNSYALSAGQPTYVLELWLASAMLAVTFPAMVIHAGYFKFWPLARNI